MQKQRNKILSAIVESLTGVLPVGSNVYLYGSRARGDFDEDSDWDILILVNKNENLTYEDDDKIFSPLFKIMVNESIYISALIYTVNEWLSKSFTPFYKNVEHDKIQLI